jgi:heme-degrading monooxygenase HmoA
MTRSSDGGYVAVIFTSVRKDDAAGYDAAALAMEELAATQPGFLGVESARNDHDRLGITVSYWRDDAAATAWKRVAEHAAVQRLGREQWYSTYRVRVATVVREYAFGQPS